MPRGNVSRLASDARRLALYCQGNHPSRPRARALVGNSTRELPGTVGEPCRRTM